MKIKLDMSPEYTRSDEAKGGIVSKAEITFDTYEQALSFHQKLTNLVKEHSDALSAELDEELARS